jgi:hypothetical protein
MKDPRVSLSVTDGNSCGMLGSASRAARCKTGPATWDWTPKVPSRGKRGCGSGGCKPIRGNEVSDANGPLS